MKGKKARVRFAPSPTGFLHIGSARTALFNYLFSKKREGVFVLRIEDTDRERSEKRFEEDIKENLKWLGLEWNEEYKQSQRSNLYEEYLKKLLEENKAYYCFCSKEELEAQKQDQISRGVAPKYSGKCAKLSEKEIEENLKKGKDYVIRFKVPAEKVKIKDLIRGEVEFDTGLIGDIVIAKNLKTPLYNFAAAIDDYKMGITHVIRGEDHLSNTPKQILLQKALRFPHPEYAHLPLILGPDKSKLSKRHGAVSVLKYREEGYLPEAVINFLALLGWNPGTEREIYSLNSLVKDFSLEKVQKSGAVFNFKKLDSLNSFYIRQKTPEKITALCLPYLIAEGLISPEFETQERIPSLTGYFGREIVQKSFIIKETEKKITFERLKKIVSIYQERLVKLSEITELTGFFFKEKIEYKKDLLKWKDMTDKELEASLDKTKVLLSKIEDWNKENLEKIMAEEAKNFALNLKGSKNRGYLLWPLRVALTGQEASAGPFEIAEILGKEKSLKRVGEAFKRI